ncbi:putative Transmembrane protein [Melia azedarach]|uniref:Transmembrane protein n=1 Tax=Melia azedarach TaxID=155640 RepID=A0ACC1XN69_MELAZ|nr:putative Transmembrane protein [Melia azedarach]
MIGSDMMFFSFKILKSCHFVYGLLKLQGRYQKRQNVLFAISQDQSEYTEINPEAPEQVSNHPNLEDISLAGSPSIHYEGSDGKPGLISFYNRPYKREDEISISNVQKSRSGLVWLVGPAVLVASFIFPSLYLRKIISMIFEDSLLTDFLILFFTEALFYCGVAVFLLLIDRLRRPIGPYSAANNNSTLPPQLGQRISSVAALVLSLIIPMVTMGLVWPWTGPAASATLAPYLVGIVVQFAFEQYARYWNSPSWPVIPIIFQVYRLHQLNRAAQLVTALSFTVRGAEVTSHNLAINNSLGALLNVLQLLGVICIWSLSSFLMRIILLMLKAGERKIAMLLFLLVYTLPGPICDFIIRMLDYSLIFITSTAICKFICPYLRLVMFKNYSSNVFKVV